MLFLFGAATSKLKGVTATFQEMVSYFSASSSFSRQWGRGRCPLRGHGCRGPLSDPAAHRGGPGLPEEEGGPGRRRGRLVHSHHWLPAHGHQAQQARCVGTAATQASPPQQ